MSVVTKGSDGLVSGSEGTRMGIKRVLAVASISLSMAGAVAIPVSSASAGRVAQSREVELVIDTVDGRTLSALEVQAHDQLVAAPDLGVQASGEFAVTSAAVLNGQVSVVYLNANTPTEVKIVMEQAIADWASSVSLNPNAPLEMSVNWTNLGNPFILGSAGAERDFLGGPWATDDWVPAPLANVLAGYDYNPGRVEVVVNFNSAFADWHLDPSTPPPFTKFDLYSVALHEIGHGMGFAGTAEESGADLELTAGASRTYDRHITFGDVPILEARLTGDPRAILASGNLFFDLGNGRRYSTFAPDPFQSGSSYSHFDEGQFGPGAPGALMTPSMSNGEMQRSLDVPTLGVLSQIGWPMALGPASPTIDWVNPSHEQIQLGWSEDLYQKATPAHSYNIGAYRSGVLDASIDVHWSDTTAILKGIQPGSDYEIVLTPVSPEGFGEPAKVNVRSANDPSDTQPPTTPGQPVIEAQDDGRNSTITWPAATDNIGVIKYRVFTAGDNALIKTVLAPKALLSLDIGTHNVYATAVDAAGNSSPASGLVQIVVTADPIQELANAGSFTSEHSDVLRLYWAFFSRDPDAGGAQYWIDISNAGFSLDVIAEQFAVSEEFQNTYGATADDAFLRVVYSNVLGRAADLSGYTYWLGQMETGLSRGGVVRWIAANNEFIVQHPYPA
jgi:hypothetical protein